MKQKKILVVDDNPFNRALIRGILEAEGACVEEAQNGKEAVEAVSRQDFDIVLMDLLMPLMDGFETTTKIRAMGLTLPIIAVSAISLKQDKKRAIEAGCTDFLPKPVEANSLIDTIGKNLDSRTRLTEPEPNRNAFQIPAAPYTILLLEADNKTAETYCGFFNTSGFNVLRSADGNDGIDLLRKQNTPIDIVVSNIHTPGIDAIGLLAIVKREFPDKLFFIYTPQYDPDTFQLAIQQGVDGISESAQMQTSMINTIYSAISAAAIKGSKMSSAVASKQLQSAQSQLIQQGCSGECPYCDMAYSSIHVAGGDLARCRRFNLAGRCGIVLADVAGHDVFSSYISAVFLGLLSSHWDRYQEPLRLLEIINHEFHKLGFQNSHICLTAVLFDRLRKRVKIATAGNPGGILIRKRGNGSHEITELSGGGMCLGLLKDSSLFVYEEQMLEHGGHIIFFSDGIESRDALKAVNEKLDLFESDSTQGISRKLLDTIFDKKLQDDDTIITCLHIPGAGDHSGRHAYSFKSSYEAVNDACGWAGSVLTPETLPKGTDADFVMLSLREALLNAVEHGNGNNPDKFVDMAIHFEKHGLRIDVSDEGCGFDLDLKLKESREYDNFQIGKRGIPLITTTADRIESSGGTVSMFFDF